MPSQQLINIIIKATDQASAAAQKVDQNLRKIGESGSRLSKIPGFDAMKTKISGLATTLDGKLGGALTKARNGFNTIRTSIGNVGSTIKGKFGGAVDGVRNKLTALSNGSKGLASSMNFLKGAASMTAGLIGFELVSGLIEAGRAAINASSQLDYFGQRLNKMSGQSHLSSQQFKQFKSELGDLQKEFRKVDMTSVGATAEEMAVKMNLPANKLSDLTRMTAVMSSTFVKEGRSQEDAILAVSDAMDGQFRRLQEIGISQDDLMANGWDGNLENQAGLIDALNKTMKDMGYEQTAKDITNLDEAFAALSIAGGQLLSAILIPLTPILIQIVDALLMAADAVKPFIDALTGAIGGMPDWAKYAGLIMGFAVVVNIVAGWITATLVPALAAAALAALDFAAAMLANPLTWYAIAIMAIVVAIYEIGKAFGWWTDVSSMLDAVWAGIQRLWNAFINHPDVQATIQALSEAWDVLSSAIGGVISWIGSFFEASGGGNFDVVRALIEGIGIAWDNLTAPIRAVISIVEFLKDAFKNVGSSQIDIVAALTNAWTFIQTFIGNTLLQISMAIVNWGIQIFTAAVSAGQSFVNGVITYIKILPGRLLMYLFMTAAYIRIQFTNMVTTARQKALQLVNAVANLILGLPRRMLSGLLGGVTSIVTAGGRWVSNARTQAGKVVTAVSDKLSGIGGAISGALSGVVNAFTKPFKDAYSAVADWVGKIKAKAKEVPVIGGAFGGEDLPLAYGGEDLISSQVGSIEKMEIHTTSDVNLNLDLRNVPSGIDETVLRNALVESLTSKDVLSVLVNNNDFQSLDNRAKARILARNNRARGV